MSNEHIGIILSSSLRVIRGDISLEELQTIFPSLEARSLQDPRSLSDSQRRLLLDLPPAADEELYISRVSTRTRDQLLVAAATDASVLSAAEQLLVANRFWPELTGAEKDAVLTSYHQLDSIGQNVQIETWERLRQARGPAYLGNEEMAFNNARVVQTRREIAERQQEFRQTLGPAFQLSRLDRARPWIRLLHEAIKGGQARWWGFACIMDATARQLNEDEYESFDARKDAVLAGMRLNNAANVAADSHWLLQIFTHAPNVRVTDTDGRVRDEAIAKLRVWFEQVKLRPRRAVDSAIGITAEDYLAEGILSNTFLVIEQRCINSVRAEPAVVDDMVILAVDASAPLSDANKGVPPLPEDGQDRYRGYTWVRLPQICNRFYEARWLHEDVGMEQLWLAAQSSSNAAFVSLDPEEAAMSTRSTTSASVI